jgi:predicted aspartyl protease
VASLESREVDGREPGGSGFLGLLLLASSLPALLLAIAALTGIGLERHLAGVPAALGALALVLLPVVGLVSLVAGSSRPSVFGGCAWFWALTILLVMPFYFPNERAGSVAAGLTYLSGSTGEEARGRLVGIGDELMALLGSEPEHLPVAVALPSEPDRTQPPAGSTSVEPRRAAATGEVTIPYGGEGQVMRIAAFFDGPRYGEEFPMIFDTGASYTTLDRAALEQLELEVPESAPIAVLRTANGEIEAPLVLADAVWLGEALVEWVTVAVCDPCAGDGSSGLLGLNVSGQFQVAIDHSEQEIVLRPREGREARRVDIIQWLQLRSRMRHWSDGRVEVEVSGRNLARIGIREAAAHVTCGEDRFEVWIGDVAPGDSVTARVSLPLEAVCGKYAVELASAKWALDRF